MFGEGLGVGLGNNARRYSAKKKPPDGGFVFLAEREGFEPSKRV